MKGNRKIKDSVFTDLFQNHRTAKINSLNLYNALHGTTYSDPSIVTHINVDDIVCTHIKNDVSFLIGDEILVLIEHQSTICENMPLRSVLYAAHVYDRLVPVKDRYRRKLVKIPTPEFFVLYNGKQNYEEKATLLLSDAFKQAQGKIPLEVEVKFFNINKKGKKLLQDCDILRQYTDFVETIRRYDKQDDGFRKAIQECIRNDILKDYLQERGVDIINFLTAEYDYETDMAVQRLEGREDILKKSVLGFQELGLSESEIAKKLDISEEEVRKFTLSDQK